MTAKDIRAGMNCTVGWFKPGGQMGYQVDYLARGKIVRRQGGRVKFQWQSGDEMDCDFIATPHWSIEFFWVNVLDIRSINGTPIKEWALKTK